jgi:uncharacterized membrane protein YdbT with pleckstrin-like domain
MRGAFGYCLLLLIVYVGYAAWNYHSPDLLYIKRVAGVLGLLLFVRWMIGFLNLYLDCLLLSKETLTIFLRDGLLEYRTELIDWSRIDAISYNQNTLWDRIL